MAVVNLIKQTLPVVSTNFYNIEWVHLVMAVVNLIKQTLPVVSTNFYNIEPG
jgi:hypothetical protein